jgi:hypothetical protein
MASDAQDEIAKLKAQAAKAREDAARLAKVRQAEWSCRSSEMDFSISNRTDHSNVVSPLRLIFGINVFIHPISLS